MGIVAGVGDLVQRTEDGCTGRVLHGRGSRGRVALCAVCIVRVETRSAGFFVEPQNQGQWFGLKTTGTVFPVWPQNRWQ
jgi:hypothetical protein